MAVRVIDQLIDGQAGVLTQREGGFVREQDVDRAAIDGFDHITLKDRFTGLDFFADAVGAYDKDGAFRVRGLTDGARIRGGREDRRCRLCVLASRLRCRQVR